MRDIGSTLSALGIAPDAFSVSGLVGGILFSFIGFVAFLRGRKAGETRTLILGIALMVYPYFVANALLVWLIGIGLSVALYFFRGE